ncbi:unnamed protein product [Cuscuta epithymum]|uniref:RING-type E3 ubiquitin transferase n=1 Tax=Cuscuta epithymum TaxID=186058 RepID=A0AAV0EPU9_9ASTE|nr:unnamed protein product [Cuscuta epithymum]
MQGQKSTIGSFPESLGFNHGSTSADAAIDQQICWTQNLIPDYMVSSTDAIQERQELNGWSLGESSSRSIGLNQVSENDPKPDPRWSSSPMGGFPVLHGERLYGASNILSLNSNNAEVNINTNHNHTTGKGLFMHGSTSSGTSPRNLNMNSAFEVDDDTDEDDDDDCLVMECVTAYKSEVPANDRVPHGSTSSFPWSAGSSGSGGYLARESEGRPHRLSCKRKTIEGHIGQSSSGSGSSSYFHQAEGSVWPNNTNVSSDMPRPSRSYNNSVNLPEPINPRLGLSIGSAVSEAPIGLLSSSRSSETSRRNFRLRINNTSSSPHHQEPIPQNLFPSEPDIVNATSRILNNNMLNTQSTSSATYNANPQGPVRVPALRPNTQARWNIASSSRSGNPVYPVAGERDYMLFDEPSSRGMSSRNMMSQPHPIFTPDIVSGSHQSPTNWGLHNVNVNNVGGGNVASGSTSRVVSNPGAHSGSLPPWAAPPPPHRNPTQYPRRITEFVRRSLLSSSVATDSGMMTRVNNPPSIPGSSSANLQEAIGGHSGNNHGQHRSSRSSVMLERQVGAAAGAPYSWRGLAAAGEGRSRLVSEIRNVLDLMRRGENLRIEDVMILDHSILFGMADIHDRHRDMRLDVDNMSYEELLALEERIGNVCTGLTEDTIVCRLKHRKYTSMVTVEPVETEPCCICQEEYNDGDDLGTLDCGHDFHKGCINQWLKHKNLCPICKTTGLAT